MQEDKELLDMPSFTNPRLEERNGTDLLNATDEYGRTALQIAFKYKARDSANVLLHYGAEHPTNLICRAQKSNYVLDAMRGNIYGLDDIKDDLSTLMIKQKEAIMREVYPKFDSAIYFLMQQTDCKPPKRLKRTLTLIEALKAQ